MDPRHRNSQRSDHRNMNIHGFESWLAAQGVSLRQVHTKIYALGTIAASVDKPLDDWDAEDVLALMGCAHGVLGRAIRDDDQSTFSNAAHAAKLYTCYKLTLSPPGATHDRLVRRLSALEQLSPSKRRWRKEVVAAMGVAP